MPSARERWFAEVLQAALDTRLITEQDVLAHATPAVLIASLPKDALARVFDGALAANQMSPKSVVETVTLGLLAEAVPPPVTWGCIAQLVERAGITAGKPADATAAREYLRRTLASALATGVITPRDLVQHVDAQVLATCFPDALTTKLLEASLASGKLDPELIVETFGVDAIAKHAPVEILWACFAKQGEGAPRASSASRTLELMDDEVATILVDLDDSVDGKLDKKLDKRSDKNADKNRAATTKPS